MNKKDSNVVVLILFSSIFTLIVSKSLTPTRMLDESLHKLNLEEQVPMKFGPWVALSLANNQLVLPENLTLINKLYDQTLSRTYVNKFKSQSVMVSIAYGSNQSDKTGMHYPEACYPAQGYSLSNKNNIFIKTKYGNIKARSLVGTFGNRREQITYWTLIGTKQSYSGLDTKINQLRYGFKGYIPDGIIFRISTINADDLQGFSIHDSFINQLLPSIAQNYRYRYMGFDFFKTDRL